MSTLYHQLQEGSVQEEDAGGEGGEEGDSHTAEQESQAKRQTQGG